MISDEMKKHIRVFMKEWGEPLLVAALLALLIRTFIAAPYKIPTGSMKPTLQEKDRLFVNKFIYRFREPQRGDIIVFRAPTDKKDFIKRLIAKGTEIVEIKNGDIYINGELVEDPFIIRSITYVNREPYGGINKKVKVPEDNFYMLGDNSASSRDSRYWGFVPRKNIIGKAMFIFWPPNRIRWLR